MNQAIPLPGLRGNSPAAALALYGTAYLLGSGSSIRWARDDLGWHGVVESDTCRDLDDLVNRLTDAIAQQPLAALPSLAKDLNELRRDGWKRGQELGGSVARVVTGLGAQAPLRDGGQVSMTPLCVYSFGSRGRLFGNAVKQDATLRPAELRSLLTGPWVAKRDVNTLGLDPTARRQDGATMGLDPSADKPRGVPGLVPLALRGLGAVTPQPSRPRAVGGAFTTVQRTMSFEWPLFTVPVPSQAVTFVAGRRWSARTPAARTASGVEAVFAAKILRDERRLAQGRRVA